MVSTEGFQAKQVVDTSYLCLGRRSALEKLPLPTDEEPPDSVSVEEVLIMSIVQFFLSQTD